MLVFDWRSFRSIASSPINTIPCSCLFVAAPRSWLFAIAPTPTLITHYPATILLNKRISNVPSSILRNRQFCFLTSFWIVSVTSFNNKPESSRDLTVLRMSFISSFDIISAILPDRKIFFMYSSICCWCYGS